MDLDKIEEIALAFMYHFDRGSSHWTPADKTSQLVGLT